MCLILMKPLLFHKNDKRKKKENESEAVRGVFTLLNNRLRIKRLFSAYNYRIMTVIIKIRL